MEFAGRRPHLRSHARSFRSSPCGACRRIEGPGRGGVERMESAGLEGDPSPRLFRYFSGCRGVASSEKEPWSSQDVEGRVGTICRSFSTFCEPLPEIAERLRSEAVALDGFATTKAVTLRPGSSTLRERKAHLWPMLPFDQPHLCDCNRGVHRKPYELRKLIGVLQK